MNLSNLAKINIWTTHFSIATSEVFATSAPFSPSSALSDGLLVMSPTLGLLLVFDNERLTPNCAIGFALEVTSLFARSLCVVMSIGKAAFLVFECSKGEEYDRSTDDLYFGEPLSLVIF